MRSAKNLERLSKKQSNNQATDLSGTVDFFSAFRDPLKRNCFEQATTPFDHCSLSVTAMLRHLT